MNVILAGRRKEPVYQSCCDTMSEEIRNGRILIADIVGLAASIRDTSDEDRYNWKVTGPIKITHCPWCGQEIKIIK